jgi:hypothetical protein
MDDIKLLVENHEKLTNHFGCWPSFHDAEVIDLHYWRGDIKPGDWDDSNVFPVLTVQVLILRATQRDHDSGKPDILTTLRFYDVEDFKMEGFNHVNQIVDFSVTSQERGVFANGDKLPPWLLISFKQGFGISTAFRCFRVEILEAVEKGS